jgi:hypothetical protein
MEFIKWLLSGSAEEKTLPSFEVQEVIATLTKRLEASYEEGNELILQEIYKLAELSSKFGEYSRISPAYKSIGFQREDPITDIRGSGLLALENVCFFLSRNPQISKTMIKKRENREEGINYPWAAVGVNITRILAVTFECIQNSGAKVINFSAKPYWHLLLEEESFNRLYCCFFVVLDRKFDELNGTYSTFPLVLIETNKAFLEILESHKSISSIENFLGMY